jgi:hypothetical protein
MYQYICKKCNIPYEKDVNCSECSGNLFKIPDCSECYSKIDNYPLEYDIDSQFCDFCGYALCLKCSKIKGCTFHRCTDCGVSHCFWSYSDGECEYCELIPIGKFKVHEECDCYKNL